MQWCFVKDGKFREMMELVRGKGVHLEICWALEYARD
jgi:hypothetical protein